LDVFLALEPVENDISGLATDAGQVLIGGSGRLVGIEVGERRGLSDPFCKR